MKVAIVKADAYELRTVEQAIGRLLGALGYDPDNPLAGIVKPGDTVFIKPNWVSHEYRKSCPRQDTVYSTITHPVLVRVIADCVAKALKGKGEIRIGDNPSIDADFDKLMRLQQLDDLQTRYNVPCKIMDLRPLRCADLKDYGQKDRMQVLAGDPRGETEINLGRNSLFYGVDPRRFRGVFTDRTETILSHTGETHRYVFSRSIVESDVYISLPKLKTHHKAGITVNLKGLVGTVSNKNTLVHWKVGWPALGGDEYGSLPAWLTGLFRRVKKRGAWSGNDTIWRMVVDIYHAFRATRARRCFSVVDGIAGGEGNGPFCPAARQSGVLLAGDDLAAVDCVACRLMGFDVRQVPYLRHLLDTHEIDCDDIHVSAADMDTDDFFDTGKRHLAFRPPDAWDNLVRCRKS